MHAGRYGQQAGGTHPTGMHTCLCIVLTQKTINEEMRVIMEGFKTIVVGHEFSERYRHLSKIRSFRSRFKGVHAILVSV